MANRYRIRKVSHYEVVDLEQDGYIAMNTKDKSEAEQYLEDLERNHKNRLDAQERLAREAAELRVDDVGTGGDQQ